jgi:hypothetical protein
MEWLMLLLGIVVAFVFVVVFQSVAEEMDL